MKPFQKFGFSITIPKTLLMGKKKYFKIFNNFLRLLGLIFLYNVLNGASASLDDVLTVEKFIIYLKICLSDRILI